MAPKVRTKISFDAKPNSRSLSLSRSLFQAMWLMLQQEEPDDFVIATGEVHSVREFVEKAFRHVGKTIV